MTQCSDLLTPAIYLALFHSSHLITYIEAKALPHHHVPATPIISIQNFLDHPSTLEIVIYHLSALETELQKLFFPVIPVFLV